MSGYLTKFDAKIKERRKRGSDDAALARMRLNSYVDEDYAGLQAYNPAAGPESARGTPRRDVPHARPAGGWRTDLRSLACRLDAELSEARQEATSAAQEQQRREAAQARARAEEAAAGEARRRAADEVRARAEAEKATAAAERDKAVAMERAQQLAADKAAAEERAQCHSMRAERASRGQALAERQLLARNAEITKLYAKLARGQKKVDAAHARETATDERLQGALQKVAALGAYGRREAIRDAEKAHEARELADAKRKAAMAELKTTRIQLKQTTAAADEARKKVTSLEEQQARRRRHDERDDDDDDDGESDADGACASPSHAHLQHTRLQHARLQHARLACSSSMLLSD